MIEPQLEFGFFSEDVPASAPPAPKSRALTPKEFFQEVYAQVFGEPPVELDEMERATTALHAALEARSGLKIQLRITDNRSTVMSVRYANSGRLARVGLHRMFLLAERDIVDALAHWVKHPRSRKHAATLNAYIRENNDLIAAKKPRALALKTVGKVYDLQRLYDEVNAAHFGGRVAVPITWGKMPAQSRRRSIRFGSYAPGEQLVRIHPLLDDALVPEFFVRYIVFHEMLHADLGIEEGEGRRVIHSREFRARERAYPDFARASAWLEEPGNLRGLLGRARHKAHR